MVHKCFYKTPKLFSNIIYNSDGKYLTGLWLEDIKDSLKYTADCEEKDLKIFKDTRSNRCHEPYWIWKTMTYNDISKIIVRKRGISKRIIDGKNMLIF